MVLKLYHLTILSLILYNFKNIFLKFYLFYLSLPFFQNNNLRVLFARIKFIYICSVPGNAEFNVEERITNNKGESVKRVRSTRTINQDKKLISISLKYVGNRKEDKENEYIHTVLI